MTIEHITKFECILKVGNKYIKYNIPTIQDLATKVIEIKECLDLENML